MGSRRHLILDGIKFELSPETVNRVARDMTRLLAENDHENEEVKEVVKLWSAFIHFYVSDWDEIQRGEGT